MVEFKASSLCDVIKISTFAEKSLYCIYKAKYQEKILNRPVSKIFWFCLICLVLLSSCQKSSENIYLHYLGHSAVYLDFGHEISVLCDYGNENAYLEWAWDSPIFEAGSQADIMCYSHFHADHFDSLRAANFSSIKLSGKIDTVISSLHISSIPSSEKDISRYDNYSFLFEYKGKKVLHLGDCQADIMTINDPAHAWNISKRYPKESDILIMPIQGRMKYTLQAWKFAELLSPRSLLPTHYWSLESKDEFLDIMMTEGIKGKTIKIVNRGRANYKYKSAGKNKMLILNLSPGKRKG